MNWATGVRLTPHDNVRGCCDDIQCDARVRAMVNTAFRSSSDEVQFPLKCFTLEKAQCAKQDECKKGDDNSCRPANMNRGLWRGGDWLWGKDLVKDRGRDWVNIMSKIIEQARNLRQRIDGGGDDGGDGEGGGDRVHRTLRYIDRIDDVSELEDFDQARRRVLPLVRRILETSGKGWNYKGERYHIYGHIGLTFKHVKHRGNWLLLNSSIEVAQAMQHLGEIYQKLEREKGDYGQLREVQLAASDELVIFGDLHGMHSDLHRWWDEVGHPADTPPTKKYLFLGDYVDRGKKDVELAFELLALQHKYPTRVFLLRGNHEDRNTSNMYGFKEHCLQYDGSWREKHLTVKWDDDGFVDSESLEAVKRARSALHSRFMDIFDLLPVAALVRHGDAKRYFCVHGGLSKRLENIDTLNKIQRPPREHSDLIYELCWSDPSRHPDCKVPSRTPHPLTTCDDAFETRPGRMDWMSGFRDKPNPDRPIFDKNAVENFTEHNEITHIFRGHQVPDGGYDFPFGSESDPTGGKLTTVFSAPWYSQRNVGAAVVLRGEFTPDNFVLLHGIRGLSGI